MTYVISRFQRWHLAWLEGNGEPSEGYVPQFPPHILRTMESGLSWTGSYVGQPIVCGGLIEMWPGRYHCWAFLNDNSAKHMLWITRAVLDKLGGIEGRIEMTVRRDFKAGHRWAKLLGFSVENAPGILEKFGPMGEDHIAYVRFNR